MSPRTPLMSRRLHPISLRCYNQASEAVQVGIMRSLQSIAKAVLALHRWFMKHSGTTMIIDNIEERRRLRRSEESSEEDSGNRDKRDALHLARLVGRGGHVGVR
jgi:hypothetical protein